MNAHGTTLIWRAALVAALLVVIAFACLSGAATPAGATVATRDMLGSLGLPQYVLPVADGAAGDHLGEAVAISGDTAVVGAPEASVGGKAAAGVAYVFVRSSGVWKRQQKLDAGSFTSIPGERFGSAVAIAGDTVVIGARYGSAGDVLTAGAAYVFVRSGGVWKFQQKLTAVDAVSNDGFGWSVAISGNTVLVGAPYRDTGAQADTGAAYVFVRFGAAWATQQILRITPLSAFTQDHFGESVALSGDTALVGVPNLDIVGGVNAGAAYVYTRDGTVWTPLATPLYAIGSFATGDWFGGAVALSGDTALIGAAGHDIGANANAGAAYLFVRAGGVWGTPQLVTAGDVPDTGFFGGSVALSGGTAAIGTIHHDAGAVPDAGAIYVITRSGATWGTAQTILTANAPVTGDWFGRSLGVSGDTIVSGAPMRDAGGLNDSGAGFVFQPAPTIVKVSPTSGRRGALVTITGKGFGRTRGASYVKFGAFKCTKYVSWSTTRIRCRVPAAAAYGSRRVRVTLKSGASNAKSFTVKR